MSTLMLPEIESPIASAPVGRYAFSITVVIPAYNEAPRVGATIAGVRAAVPEAEIIVIDDASKDDTYAVACAAGAKAIRRPHNNGGPGAPIKRGIREASGDVIVIIDSDGQHDPNDIPRLLAFMDVYDMVIAARPGRNSHENFHRYLGNLLLNKLGSYLIELEMKDLTSGLRAMRRSVMLEFIHLLPNGFSWAMTSALSFAKAGYTVRFEPMTMHKRQGGQSTQKLFKNGFKFGMIILRMVSLFAPLRFYTPIALTLCVLGVVSFLYSFFVTYPFRLYIPNSALIFFIGSILTFLYGLQAEAIAALRFKGPER